jgi:hypothetical protein
MFQQKHSWIKAQKFEKLCEQALIDHRIIYCDIPKVDGLVEKIVQMVKKGLEKYGLKKGIHVIGTYSCHGWQWDTNLRSKCPFHHFPFIFCFLGMNLNY